MKKIPKWLIWISLAINCLLICAFFYNRTLYQIIRNTDAANHTSAIIQRERSEFFSSHPEINSSNIVMVGTSMTESFPVDILEVSIIKKRAISGIQTKHLLKRIGSIARGKPKIIILEIGINDVLSKIPFAIAAKNFKDIIDSIQTFSPGTKIYTQSILPVSGSFADLNPEIIRLNNFIEKFSLEKSIRFIDTYPYFVLSNKLNPSFSADNVHLNGAGYLKWKEVLDSIIK